MPRPSSHFTNRRPLGSRKVYIRVDKDQGPALDEFIANYAADDHTLVTSRTGSRGGQHCAIWTNKPNSWLRAHLDHIPGITIDDRWYEGRTPWKPTT